ncbi:uncharacterized protein LOC142768304 [Rhipicephalus microplus]|uniref:uncharacterized protein LOC142768304 n=1 Tax=Rhipicephalus microplus TaxID=6941 RepID=UPI003F6C7A9B
MSKASKSSSRARHDSQMDPKKKIIEEDDSGLGTSKSQTRTSGATSGKIHDPSKAGPSLSMPGPSHAKSPAKKAALGTSRGKLPGKKSPALGRSQAKSPIKKSSAPGARQKSPLKKAMGLLLKSPSPKPPAQGVSPSSTAARMDDWVEMQSETAPVKTDPETGLPVPVYHEPKFQIFENRTEVVEQLPAELLEEEGIRTKPPLASMEDLTSPTSPDSPIPSTSFKAKATISDAPPQVSSPSPPRRGYYTRQAARKARSHVKEQKSPLSDIFSANTILLATLATLASTVVVVYAPVYIEKHFAACHSPKCMDLRTDLALMMDSEADPCRDFYRFVCANFESVYPRSPSYMDAFTKLVKQSFREMLNQFVVESPVVTEHYPLSAYRQCIDSYKAKYHSLDAIINNDDDLVEIWNNIRDRNTMNWKFDYLMKLSLDRGTPVFIGADVVRNAFTRRHYMLRIKAEKVKQPSDRRTVINIIELFKRESSWVGTLKVSKAIMATMRGVADALRDLSTQGKVPEVWSASQGLKILHGVSYNRLHQTLARFPPPPGEWKRYFFTTDAAALLPLTKYLSTVTPTAFAYSVRFIIAESLLTTATYQFVQVHDLSPTAAYRLRAVRCADLSLMLLPTFTEYHFFQEWLGQQRTGPTLSLLTSLREKFSLVEPFFAMRQDTKKNLESTLRNITVIPGHDPGYDTLEDLHRITGFEDVSSDFTAWVFHTLRTKAHLQGQLMVRTSDVPAANEHRLDLNPGVLYDASEDTLRVLPSLLLAPFDVANKPSAFTFGHLGTYATEAFARATLPDSLSGNASRMNYTSQVDHERFFKELDCILGERKRPDADTLALKAALNLLTSVIGIKVAYRASKDRVDRETSTFVPNVKTDEQAFFVGHCLRYCGATQASNETDAAKGHVLSRRDLCNLPLRHIPEFAGAFSCSANSNMVAVSDCR